MEREPMSGLLTGRQAQELLGVSRTSLFRMSRDGRIPRPCELGNGKIRWREDEIREWLKKLPSRQYPLRPNATKASNASKHGGQPHA